MIVLAAGGTGGHIFPAEALARELLARGRKVALVTDRRGQAFAVPGVETHRIRAGRFQGGVVAKAIGIAELLIGTVEAKGTLRRLGARAVVGFGGYPSVPTVLAATRLGLATVIHEQNAVLGKANRLLARRVGRIATSFRETALLGGAAVFTGNPVRPQVAPLRDQPYAAPGETIELLVLGGSQGARIFSEIVPAAVARLPNALSARLRISQQARPEDLASAANAYADTGAAVELKSFFDDVPARLGRAHLVIARAGASTLTELAIAGRPAILVPYPHAADDHQTANARAFAAAGGGWLAPQSELTAEALAERLAALLGDGPRLVAAAGAARQMGEPRAAANLADLVLASMGESRPSKNLVTEFAA